MRHFNVTLESEPSNSFRCTKAANSLDIDVAKKLRHVFDIDADLEAPFNVGLIVGASGSGKTTLARQIAEYDFEVPALDPSRPVIDQFPEDWSYDRCAKALSGVGLTQVVCWIRPAGTLSNGQRARAEVALQLASGRELIFIDEWTSVVDRTVAKVMSHCVQRHARKTGRQVVLLSCHYDVLDWLQPDWVIDCNEKRYIDRRSESRIRSEKLEFEFRPATRASWGMFSQYHYLSEKLPGGKIYPFGLFIDGAQIGFHCFVNYVPHRKGTTKILHSSRCVIHPDYVGFALGILMVDAGAAQMKTQGFRVMSKLSALPTIKSRVNSPNWRLCAKKRNHKMQLGGSMMRRKGFRLDVTTYSFEYVGPETSADAIAAARNRAAS